MAERPLRILQICTADVGGGAEKTAWKLHRRYRELGHDSLLAVGRRDSDDPNVIPIDNSARRRAPRRFAARVTDRIGLQDLWLPGGGMLLDVVGKVDIVHAHNLHIGYFDLAALRGLSAAAPTILTLQDMWLLTGHCAHSFDCERWSGGCGQCPDLTIFPAIRHDVTAANHRRKRRILGPLAVSLSTPSQWLLERVRHSYLAEKPARVIPNAVDTAVFRPGDRAAARHALGLPLARPLVLYPANMGLDNGFKDAGSFLGALERLGDLDPLGIAFGHSGRLGERADLVVVPQTHNEATMALYFQAADVTVYPSRADTFPLALLEALATGTPPVATRVGGIPEIIEEGETGFLVPPADDEELAAALRRLLVTPELRQRMGANGVARARRNYDLRDVADTWLGWYREHCE